MDGPTHDPLFDYLAARKVGRDNLGRRLDPYIGLRHFDRDTAGLLFGRSGSAEAILSKFETDSTVFVVGGSGCGKSSIVRGLVMQTLRLVTRPVQKRHGSWVAVDMRPGLAPVDALVDAVWKQIFAPLYPNSIVPEKETLEVREEAREARAKEAREAREQIDRALGVSETELRTRIKSALGAPLTIRDEGAPLHQGIEVVRAWIDRLDHGLDAAEGDAREPGRGLALPPPPPVRDHRVGSVNLMLLVDQFEEIFRPEVPLEQRHTLIAMMRHVFLNRPEGVFLAITMRAEDLHRCAEEPDLPDMVNSSTHLVGWLTRKELREAVVGPARAVMDGWGINYDRTDPNAPFDKEVVDSLVKHVAKLQSELVHKSDHLPLFQHALTVLWRMCCERWKREADNFPQRPTATAGTGKASAAPMPIHVTQADLEAVVAVVGGNPENWMARALENTVETGLKEAQYRFAAGRRTRQDTAHDRVKVDQAVVAEVCLRAAITAMASKDEQGRYHRRFVRPGEIAEDRFTELFGKDDLDTATAALCDALGVLASPPFDLLTCNNDPAGPIFDVAHESLIRNSDKLRGWLEDDAEIVAALRRVYRRLRSRAGILPRDAVQREDMPLLERVFDSTRNAGRQTEAERLYQRTYSQRNLGELALEGLGLEGT